MDRSAKYKLIVRSVFDDIVRELQEYTPEDGVRTEVVLDDSTGHYQIAEVGWSGDRRVHGILLHCDVVDGKIHVEHDGLSAGVVDMLVATGVPPTDIVVGWHPPNLRHLTPYAAA
ncbi:MAG: hypothetical protein OHK0029_10990 [Armatimonadaceae bacterium]